MTDPLTVLGALVGATAISMVALARSVDGLKDRLSPAAIGGLLIGGFLLYAVSMLPFRLLESWAVSVLVGVLMLAETVAFSLLTKHPPQP